jgi:protein-tyrosine phosphatase
MVDVNPAIGSGFNADRGTFAGDDSSSGTSSHSVSGGSADHPFHNVDHNTMVAMKKALVVLQKVKGDNSVHQIADRLYLGSIGAALNLPELQTVGITHILCTATGVRSMHPDKFVYKTLTVLDSQSESLIDHFADSIYWLECVLRESSENKVLVHCFAGRSRSVAIILAYLMYKLRIPLSVALLHVRQFRASANPNIGFINQLKAFEQELFESNRSFSFDTLFDDLSSLLPGAKDRLKTIKDGRVSFAGGGQRSSSAIVSVSSPNRASRGRRASSSETPRLDRNLSGLGELPSNRHNKYSGTYLSRWLFLLLLAMFVVSVEKVSFPHYSKMVCDNWRGSVVQSMCERVQNPSRRLEGELLRIFNRTVHLFNSVIAFFPKV